MKRSLIIIDFINDIVDPKGKIPSCAQQVIVNSTIEHANRAISWARETTFPVFLSKLAFKVIISIFLETPLFSVK